MLRLSFLVIMAIVAFFIWIFKQAAGNVMGDHSLSGTTYRQQTRETMDSAAKGINWLQTQWEEAKSDASNPRAGHGKTEKAARPSPPVITGPTYLEPSKPNAGPCPYCGFTFGWNGQSCAHCSYTVQQPSGRYY